MAKIPEVIDPTLTAVDARQVELAAADTYDSTYLGISSIGKSCLRQLWYKFRWASVGAIDNAASVYRLDDGNRCEKVMAGRLRSVPGLDLYSVDTETGKQFGVQFLGGHLRGRVDGVIEGLLQAPKTPHIWENKATKESEVKKLAKLKIAGEKAALKAWNAVYHAAAVLYMRGLDCSRHYMTVCSPGARSAVSVRSSADDAEAERLLAVGEAVVFADRAPPRLSQDPDYFECKWCPALAVCHGNDLGRAHCRSCMHSVVERDGGWSCARWNKSLTLREQHDGCPAHLYLPDMVPGDIAEADDSEEWVEYRLRNGMVWRDGVSQK